MVEQCEQSRVDESGTRVADDEHPSSAQSLAGRGGVEKRALWCAFAGLEGPAGIHRSVGDAVVLPRAPLREPIGAALEADGHPGLLTRRRAVTERCEHVRRLFVGSSSDLRRLFACLGSSACRPLRDKFCMGC